MSSDQNVAHLLCIGIRLPSYVGTMTSRYMDNYEPISSRLALKFVFANINRACEPPAQLLPLSFADYEKPCQNVERAHIAYFCDLQLFLHRSLRNLVQGPRGSKTATFTPRMRLGGLTL